MSHKNHQQGQVFIPTEQFKPVQPELHAHRLGRMHRPF